MIFYTLLVTHTLLWSASFGIISPVSKTAEIVKSGGFISGEVTFPIKGILHGGIQISGISLVLRGTGNSSLKILAFSPAIVATQLPIVREVELSSRLLLARFLHENPSNSFIFYGLGYSFGTSIKILSRPIKISLFIDYNSFPTKKTPFTWVNLGFKVGEK